MQHVNAAFTVDEQHCADAILDAVDAIEHCFPGTTAAYSDALKVSLRVIRLHSSKGDVRLRGAFEDAMRSHRWNGNDRKARVSEPPYPVGSRRYWGLVLFPRIRTSREYPQSDRGAHIEMFPELPARFVASAPFLHCSLFYKLRLLHAA
jgi:hypothetical protein